MSVPNTFASATSAIPLANLDADFAYYDAAFQIVGTAMEVNYTFRLEDPTDNTKKAEFVMSGITTGTTRQYTMPNVTGALASLGNISQTFTGSTSIVPATNGSAITIGAIPQTGTITLGRSTAAQTVDIAVGATAAATTKTVNIGTTGVSTSITNINYGSAVTGALNTHIWNAGANNMRLDSSGNLGIGTTSPGAKLEVTGGLDATYNSNILINSTTTTAKIGFNPSGLSSGIGALSTGTLVFYGNGANTERMRLDSAGNLGLGVTPSAWSGYKAIQFAVGSGFVASSDAAYRFFAGTNAYYNGTNWIYKASTQASLYEQGDSAHKWYTAPSGTAGNAITFTQAMTLDASGNLGIGTTSPSASAILDAQSTTKGVRMPNMTTTQKNAIASPAAGLMVFDTTLAKLCVYSGSAWQTITSI